MAGCFVFLSMLKPCTLLIILFCSMSSIAQTPTWSDDIAEIYYKNCSSCHHDGSIAPFELMSYTDAVVWAESTKHVLEENEMPPWPADPDYREFANQKILSDTEKQLVIDWIDNGTPEGNLAAAPLPPVFEPTGSLLDTIDLTVAIEPYTLQSNLDEYRWFVIPNPLNETVYVNKVEVMAGLPEVVHHADLNVDLSTNSYNNDLADPLPGFNNSVGGPSVSYQINAWQPGGGIARYPQGWGIRVDPGSYFIIEIHYGPGGIGLTDSTFMNLQFVKDTPENEIREIVNQWYLYDSAPVLTDGPLEIPAYEVKTFHQQRGPLATDWSLISICPHMHLLGKSYKVWAVDPDGNEIPLIDIPQWDIHWQKFYTYINPLKIPAGSWIYSEGVYDNTLLNHDNPNNPPVDVYRGLRTTDEMFLCYFIYSEYEEGDELIDMTEIIELQEPEPVNVIDYNALSWTILPNPATDWVQITTSNKINVLENFSLFSADGRKQTLLIDEIYNNKMRINVSHLDAGIYFISNGTSSLRLVISSR